ncbi:MAG: polysaccharide biosynthesis tyrosine autokinase [Candidatus Omnitrophica bacterium]|nr:polysaccharide biosynthesis tyrosine autokinase [Candidatus Omnitrophota bacterium]MCB9747012.1 polysaccharide biosynthesis tyrosine autokinase [Candidatus Omnitrophota bacterium]
MDEQLTNTGDNTLRDYLRIVFKHKILVITTFLTVSGTVFVGLQLRTPVYESSVKMLLAAEKQVESTLLKDLKGTQKAELVLTQSEIVRSNPVLERAVKSLKLDKRPYDYEKAYSTPLKAMLIDMDKAKFDTMLEKMMPQQREEFLFRRAVEGMRLSVEVEPLRDTNLFLIKVTDFDPVEAAKKANVLSRSYIIFDLEQQLAELTLKYGRKHPTVNLLKDTIFIMSTNLNGQQLTDLEAIGPASVKIIGQAMVPLKPTGSSKSVALILAVVMSGFLGIMLAFVFEFMDQTFKGPKDIEKVLGLPCLGSVPKKKFMDRSLVKNVKKNSNYTKAYLTLSDQMYLLVRDKGIKSFLFTSALSMEGASVIIANLGKFLAHKLHKPVLIIDANMRNSAMQHIFKYSAKNGLADIVGGEAALEDVVQEVDTNLSVLPAGKSSMDPISLLDSPKMTELIKKTKENYGVVLIDCAHLRKFKDAVLISPATDGTILIVEEGKSRYEVVKTAIAPLEKKKANLVGVILNNRTYVIPKFIYDRI